MLGALSALSVLQAASEMRQHEVRQSALKEKELQAQESKVLSLREHCDKLRHKLERVTCRGSNSTESDVPTDNQIHTALAHVEKLKEKLKIYKLSGVAVVKSDHDSRLLCFTTSHKGVYMESYHVRLQRLLSGLFKVRQHDLPSFVVSSCLSDNQELKDVLSLVRPVRQTLAMYVYRREVLKAAQVKFLDKLQVMETTASFDYVYFHLVVTKEIKIGITLKYFDLNSYLSSVAGPILVHHESGKTEILPKDIKRRLQEIFQSSPYLSQTINMAASILESYIQDEH